MYSTICHTLLCAGQAVLIGDPAVCEFYDRLISLSEINKGFIRILQLPSGGYYSYHKSSVDSPAFAEELLFLHDSVNLEDEFFEEDLGLVCTSLSGSVFVCVESKAFDAAYTYFSLESEALYDVDAILDILNAKEELLSAEKELMEICNLRSRDRYITGNDILCAIGSEHVPSFLRTVPSTHWSTDVARKLSYVPACTLIGGVASNTYSEFVHVYALHKNDLLVGVRICLDTDEIL